MPWGEKKLGSRSATLMSMRSLVPEFHRREEVLGGGDRHRLPGEVLWGSDAIWWGQSGLACQPGPTTHPPWPHACLESGPRGPGHFSSPSSPTLSGGWQSGPYIGGRHVNDQCTLHCWSPTELPSHPGSCPHTTPDAALHLSLPGGLSAKELPPGPPLDCCPTCPSLLWSQPSPMHSTASIMESRGSLPDCGFDESISLQPSLSTAPCSYLRETSKPAPHPVHGHLGPCFQPHRLLRATKRLCPPVTLPT